MSSAPLEFKIEIGRTFETHLSYRPGAVLANLSSNTTYIQARAAPGDTTAVFAYNTTDDGAQIEHGTYTFDGTVFNIHIKLSPTITAALTAGDCWVQVWTEDAAGDRFEVMPETLCHITQPVISIS